MNCSKILDMAYQYWHPVGASENEPHSEISTTAIFCQIQIWLHTFFCSDCAKEIERFQLARDVMQRDFFPSSPGFEDSIMARIQAEVQIDTVESAAPGGFSTRGWVIAGIVMLVSFATAFFGFDFRNLANEWGISFLLPVGITIGIVLTTYCVLFIGSHLKELSERFGL